MFKDHQQGSNGKALSDGTSHFSPLIFSITNLQLGSSWEIFLSKKLNSQVVPFFLGNTHIDHRGKTVHISALVIVLFFYEISPL